MHDNAFGTEFTKENLKKFNKYVSENVEEIEVDNTIKYVDRVENTVDVGRVRYGHYLRALTNQNVDDVLYGYKNMRINTDFVRSKGSVTTIWEAGLEFIIFNDHSVIGDKLRNTGNKFINVDIVGKPTINYWMGKGKAQIVVEDIQISK